MKLTSLMLSIATFLYLTVSYFSEGGSTSERDRGMGTTANLVEPKILSNKMLSIEDKWRAIKKSQETNAVAVTNTKPVANKQLFQIGDQSFVLYGIFYDEQSPFALIKTENEKLIKLSIGDKLSSGAILVSLSSDSISFEQDGQVIEFKLFERKNNA